MPEDDCKNLPWVLSHSQTGSSSIRVSWAGFGFHILDLTLGRCFILRTCLVSPWTKVFFLLPMLPKVVDFAVMLWLHVQIHLFTLIHPEFWNALWNHEQIQDLSSSQRLHWLTVWAMADWHTLCLEQGRQWKRYWMKQKWLVLAKQWDRAHIVNYPLFPTARIFQLPKPS